MKFIKKILLENIKSLYLLLCFIALICILLILYFDEYTIVLYIPILFICILISRLKIWDKKCFLWPLFLFVTMMIIRIVIVLTIDTPVISDFSVILNAAQNLLFGNNIMNESTYFYRYAYQTGPVIYTYLLLNICNSVTFLKIVNCTFNTLNCLIIYYISKRYISEKNARTISILYGIFVFPLFFNTVLSNQIPASTLFYLGILLFIILKDKNKPILGYVACAILLFLGNIVRCEGIIFVGGCFMLIAT